jgi:hypothetical protein
VVLVAVVLVLMALKLVNPEAQVTHRLHHQAKEIAEAQEPLLTMLLVVVVAHLLLVKTDNLLLAALVVMAQLHLYLVLL